MDDAHVLLRLAEAGLELHGAAGVAGGADLRAGLGQMAELAVQKFLRHLGLRDVVDARAAAAPVGFGQFHEVQTGNGAQQFARRLGNFLAVAKVAGLMVGHAFRRRGTGGMLQADLREPFVDVLQFLGPEFGSSEYKNW